MVLTIASYAETNESGECDLTDNWSASYSAYSQSFKTPNDGCTYTLNSVKLWGRRWNGNETGNIRVDIYAHSGVFGTSSKPTGSILASTDNYDVTGLTTSYALFTLNFTGANKISLSANTAYVFVYKAIDIAGTGKRIRIGKDTSSVPTSTVGNECYYTGSFNQEAHAICYYIYGDDVGGSSENYYYFSPKPVSIIQPEKKTVELTDSQKLEIAIAKLKKECGVE
jgi:hypothetical protein